MKHVLSLLLAFTFLQTQTWALTGGPVFATPASPNLAGVYSGVLVQSRTNFLLPRINDQNDPNFNERDPSGNIGTFTVTVNPTAASVGTTVLFIGGIVFTGTINGIADPDRMTFDGIVQGTSTVAVIVQAEVRNAAGAVIVPQVTVTPLAQGKIETRITENITRPLAGRATTANGRAARMTGKATIDAFAGVNVADFSPIAFVQAKYAVSGFRQSTTALP